MTFFYQINLTSITLYDILYIMEKKTVLIAFKTTQEQCDELNKLANETLTSVSAVIRLAIQKHLQQIRKENLIDD